MKLKNIFLIGAFLLIAFLGINFISAQACEITTVANCNNNGDNVVMKLSSSDNAHAERAGRNNYDYALCCNFGGGGTACNDIQNPNQNNKILGLSSATNAHAERPGNSDYASHICYDSLVGCFGADGATPGNEEIEVISLSSATNAHLGTSYDFNIICEVVEPVCGDGIVEGGEECDDGNTEDGDLCSSTCEFEPGHPEACDLGPSDWSLDGENDLIEEDNPVLNGQTVHLITTGIDCEGVELDFTIREYDTLSADDTIATLDGVFPSVEWVTEYVEDASGNPEYYFTVAVVGASETSQSGSPYLKVEQGDPNWCADNSVNVCADYTEETPCNNDDNWCGVADNPNNVNYDPDADDYECQWNSTSTQCEFVNIYGDGEDAVCGNGIKETGEVCDDGDLDGYACTDFGFSGGDLSCNPQCDGFTTNSCEGYSCDPNDGVRTEGEEACDPSDLAGFTCSDFDDFDNLGDLSCNDNCEFVTSECSVDPEVINSAGKCVFHYQDTGDTCEDDGFLEVSYTTTWTGMGDRPASCPVSGSESYECPAQIPLPFFNIFNMFISILLIAAIYWRMSFKEDKK